ncbi:MAG: hypothetical protein ABIG30_03850 [Candidatus Aenigmatarchaeota archaeon]
MFGLKKKKEDASTGMPVDEVRRLSQSGMSDRDIIRRLKEEGYPYADIEKAMLQAVKEGASEEEAPPMVVSDEPEPATAYAPPMQNNQDVLSQYQTNLPTASEITGEESELTSPSMPSADELSPEVAIEELVEGVVDEKWDGFVKRIERSESYVQELRTELRLLNNKLERLASKPSQAENTPTHIDEKLEDLDVRMASLERAFKQVLPSLMKNIEELSRMSKQS